ncbi:hypothetical protein [Longimycelium tulufanense]|uniref:hypothetical protein n=1 Tax=Longimycelium tulufanense TaxID=907463 RepID=UPI0016630649|nr:hypothetical protein [Longimycelium tulufanense]
MSVPRVRRWLPLLAVTTLALTGCQPEERGRILVGRDKNDAVVAVLGACSVGDEVELVITNRSAEGELARARTRISNPPLRVALFGQPPGWEVERWGDLAAAGRVQVNASVLDARGAVRYQLRSTVVDLDRVRPLASGANDDATSTC